MPSISTEIWFGSITWPTAERAWRPASHFNQQIGTAVDNFGRVIEIRRGVDHAEQFDDKIDPIERAERIAHGGKKAEPDEPRAAITFLDTDVYAKFAGELDAFTVARPLPRQIEDVSNETIGQIVGDRLLQFRQHDAELFQARFRTHDCPPDGLIKSAEVTAARASAPLTRRQCRGETIERR